MCGGYGGIEAPSGVGPDGLKSDEVSQGDEFEFVYVQVTDIRNPIGPCSGTRWYQETNGEEKFQGMDN